MNFLIFLGHIFLIFWSLGGLVAWIVTFKYPRETNNKSAWQNFRYYVALGPASWIIIVLVLGIIFLSSVGLVIVKFIAGEENL